MKNSNLMNAGRAVILAGAALLSLAGSASATVIHMCSSGQYTQTEIYWAPGPTPQGSWQSRTTLMGTCGGEWVYVQEYVAVPSNTGGVRASEADSGFTLPGTDPAVVNLSNAFAKALPPAQRKSTVRQISESEARAILSQTRGSRQLILQLPVAFVHDMRCSPPNVWNGFTCVDAANLQTSLPILQPLSAN